MRRSRLLIVALVALSLILGSVITARAATSEDVGIRWWRMNKAHEGAEIARALGGDNAAALAYFGAQWTIANNERKELEASMKDHQGVWTITAYCNDGQSSSGRPNIPGQTCACNCLPAGTVIEIEGMGRFTVTDRGASSGAWAWHNSNWCDIYLVSEAECQQWGVQHRNVWVVR